MEQIHFMWIVFVLSGLATVWFWARWSLDKDFPTLVQNPLQPYAFWACLSAFIGFGITIFNMLGS